MVKGQSYLTHELKVDRTIWTFPEINFEVSGDLHRKEGGRRTHDLGWRSGSGRVESEGHWPPGRITRELGSASGWFHPLLGQYPWPK